MTLRWHRLADENFRKYYLHYGTSPSPSDRRGLSAAPGDRAVTLRWEPNGEADFQGYLVYQRTLSGPLERIDSIADISRTSLTVQGLRNGSPYTFYLASVDRVGNHSGFSPEAGAVPAYLISAEPAPWISAGSLWAATGTRWCASATPGKWRLPWIPSSS